MAEVELHRWLTIGWFALSAVTFITLQFISAPYGKHNRDGWGPSISNRLAWTLMESPPIFVFALLFVLGDRFDDPAAWTFLALFVGHYVYRAWIYPRRLRTDGKRMPVIVCALALSTNIVIGYIQARWLFTLGPERGVAWLLHPLFIGGVALFFVGLWINRRSDAILCSLRQPGETGYRVPYGGMFRFVSSPHYFGEIVQWTGWALATWGAPTAAFLAWTLSNLVPRADETHRWYRERFPDYPPERKRVFPFLY